MGICAEELRTFVIRPTLKHLGHHSDAAEELLLGTAAKESGLGFHLADDQNKGMGIFRIRPLTHRRIWDKFLIHNPPLASTIRGLASQHAFLDHPHAELATNLRYTTAIAWLIYYRHQKPLPEAADIEGLAQFWWRHYQRRTGGSTQEFIQHYHQFVRGKKQATAA
ncbi:hypothetical protein G8770_16085 [Aestuariicella hydrocarbonica]|uniref:Uncharacterized protein n=1 Tax=Pseudomaricurvus hydrocarbonicus TaxID=1470433 RepID=A0A9E5T3K3_9GAMM|nr:hypothetical protein [Aestuariicella hydrocarbonica]NHO67069.1 hypothetical protein [Aestuariicella hydrocarbonica]